MRKIKFRGRCAGTWRKGDHLTYANGDVIKAWMGSISPEYDVERETVGQFTGLHDCDGTEIYEDDICEFQDDYCNAMRRVIAWDDYDCKLTFFRLDGTRSDFELHCTSDFKVKVIGNIHDNPELIEEAD